MSAPRTNQADVAADASFHPLRMGLAPLEIAAWLKPRPGDEAICAERARLVRERGVDVLALLPEGEGAVAEFAAFLKDRGIDLPGSTEGHEALAAIAGLIAEDLLFLTGSPLRLTAGVLCFPNRWRLHEKIGHEVTAIHAPVPDYEPSLSAPVDRFLARLRPGRVFVRENWGLAATPERYLPDPGTLVDPASTQDLYLRREEQSFVKLPESGAVVFAIRTTISRWSDVPEGQRDAMLRVIADLSPAWLAYKAFKRS